MTSSSRLLSATCAIVAGIATSAQAMTHTFTRIDYPEALCTYLEDINNSGDIGGRRWGPLVSGHDYNGLVYRGGIFHPIDYPNAFSSAVRGMNNAGQKVGFYQGPGLPVHGYLYMNGNFTTIDFPGAATTFAEGINDSGKIVGFADDAGFLYEGGLFTPLTIPGAFWVQASDVNNTDTIVGSYRDANGFHGFRYANGIFDSIDVPGSWTRTYGTYSLATDINNSNVIVGGYYEREWVLRGFVYERGVYSTIDIPGASYAFATGINDLGDVVGLYLDGDGGCHGFLVNTIPIAIDIRPGSDANRVNLRSRGVIPVAIISSPLFDAQEVNPATVALAGGEVRLRGKSGKDSCSLQDVNGDGLPDLLCKIRADELSVEPGDFTVILRGQTYGGQLIRGEDLIRILPR